MVRVAWAVLAIAGPAIAARPETRVGPGADGGATQEAVLEYLYGGRAFGSKVTALGGVVVAGESAPSAIGCGVGSASNAAADVNVPPFLATAAIENSVEGRLVADVRTSESRSVVNRTALLGGLIRARELTAVAEVSHGPGGFDASGAGSELVGLRVLGLPVFVDLEPNTHVDVLGIGHLVINEQVLVEEADEIELRVNMIHLYVTIPNPVAEVGTEVIVGSAKASLKQGNGLLSGYAFGGRAILAGLLDTGQAAQSFLPCGGTEGVVLSNNAAGIDVPGILEAGAMETEASGTLWLSPEQAVGETTALVAGVDLLNGLVTADAVYARARVFHREGDTFLSAAGSSFINLQVAGHPALDDNIPNNTVLVLEDLGYLFLKRVRTLDGGERVSVRMIELFVTVENSLGLPLNSWVVVAKADAAIESE